MGVRKLKRSDLVHLPCISEKRLFSGRPICPLKPRFCTPPSNVVLLGTLGSATIRFGAARLGGSVQWCPTHSMQIASISAFCYGLAAQTRSFLGCLAKTHILFWCPEGVTEHWLSFSLYIVSSLAGQHTPGASQQNAKH